MSNVYIIIAEASDYDFHSSNVVMAFESEEDANLALERVQTHYKVWLEAQNTIRAAVAEWLKKNPIPQFDQVKPIYDPNGCSNSEHSERVQAWRVAERDFSAREVVPYNHIKDRALGEIYQKILESTFQEAGVDQFEFDASNYTVYAKSTFRMQPVLLKAAVQPVISP